MRYKRSRSGSKIIERHKNNVIYDYTKMFIPIFVIKNETIFTDQKDNRS